MSTSQRPQIPVSAPNPTPREKRIRKVLVTGAAGYLGRPLCEVLAEDFDLVRMDINEVPGPGEFLEASVSDKTALDQACREVDALVLGHMAPNRSIAYDWPEACMDINVKGTALAVEAAARNGIKRIVLISSVSVVGGHEKGSGFLTADLPYNAVDLYSMTKVLQEDICRYYHQRRGMEFAVLRPAYILREDSLVNKYGEKCPNVTWQCIDPYDIGRAAASSLSLPDLGFEIFYLMAGPDAERFVDLEPTFGRLGWNPKHRFEGLPIEVLG